MIKIPTTTLAGMQIPLSYGSYSSEIRMSYLPFCFQDSTVFLSQGVMQSCITLLDTEILPNKGRRLYK